jgi:methanogenic corrinoid protein MtbC1
MRTKWISPKNYALRVGVSESTVKRWCDQGMIECRFTFGGHRRISIVVDNEQFVGSNDLRLQANFSKRLFTRKTTSLGKAKSQLMQSMIDGNTFDCFLMTRSALRRQRNASEFFDNVLCPIMRELGRLWETGEIDVFQERQACSTMKLALAAIATPEPTNLSSQPLAIGATLEGNHYELGALSVHHTLQNFGWTSRYLGANLPLVSWLKACEHFLPKLAWISFSHSEHSESFLEACPKDRWRHLADRCKIVLGGPGLTREVIESVPHAFHSNRVSDLIKYLNRGK